jgi:uncharacterized protein
VVLALIIDYVGQNWYILCGFWLISLTIFINKDYAEKLASKINTFKTCTNTKKSVYLTMITTYETEHNKYAHLVQNEVVMGDLFGA